jgi:MFS family permease
VEEEAAEEYSGTAFPAGSVPLRRNNGFRMLWIGQVLSETGTEAAFIAYPLLILALTHSAAIAGAIGTVSLAVQLAFGLPGGALSDRFDRRLTMIATDSVRVVALGLLTGLVLAHLVTWPVVLAVSVVDGGAAALFNPSAAAALPGIVPDVQLERAWAATEARTYAASLAGPALGGFLFGLGRAVPFLVDAISYLVSLGTVSRIRGTFRPAQTVERRALWQEAADGIRLVVRNPLLRAVLIQAPLLNFAFNGVIFTITVALQQNGSSPGVIGLAQAGIAVGGLLGAISASWLVRRLSMHRMVIILNVTGAVFFTIAALVLPSPLVAIPVAAGVVLGPAANAALTAAQTRTTPEHMRGRVSSTVFLGAVSLSALAPLVAGLLVEHFSGRWALAAFAAAVGIGAILSVVLTGFRNTEVGGTQP